MNLWNNLSRWWNNYSAHRLQRVCREQTNSVSFRKPLPTADVELFLDALGEIRHVRIGGWRVIAASETRRIVQARQLDGCRRVAVQIELHDARSLAPSCTIWELYDLNGCLLSMLQIADQQDLWISTDFQTGRVSRSDRDIPISLSA